MFEPSSYAATTVALLQVDRIVASVCSRTTDGGPSQLVEGRHVGGVMYPQTKRGLRLLVRIAGLARGHRFLSRTLRRVAPSTATSTAAATTTARTAAATATESRRRDRSRRRWRVGRHVAWNDWPVARDPHAAVVLTAAVNPVRAPLVDRTDTSGRSVKSRWYAGRIEW